MDDPFVSERIPEAAPLLESHQLAATFFRTYAACMPNYQRPPGSLTKGKGKSRPPTRSSSPPSVSTEERAEFSNAVLDAWVNALCAEKITPDEFELGAPLEFAEALWAMSHDGPMPEGLRSVVARQETEVCRPYAFHIASG